jgi:hypothetical protein
VTILETGTARADAWVVLDSSQAVNGREVGEAKIELSWLDRERLRQARPIRCWVAGHIHLLYQR